MHATLAIASLLVSSSFLPTMAAESPEESRDVQFSPPAQVGPSVVATPQWAFAILDSPGALAGTADLGPSLLKDYTEFGLLAETTFSNEPEWVALPAVESNVAQLAAKLSNTGLSSVYIEASNISWLADDAPSIIASRPAHASLEFFAPKQAIQDRSARLTELVPPGGVILFSEPENSQARFEWSATGLKVLEVHGISMACQAAQACPEGNDRKERFSEGGIEGRQLSFHRFETSGGSLSITGVAAVIMGGGSLVDAIVTGTSRLPLASCVECPMLDQQTLTVDGKLTLRSIRSNGDGRFSATLEGKISSARIDETSIDPAVLWSNRGMASAAVGLGAIAILKFLLAPFFTRLTKEKALEHPRRKIIFDYIRDHPGANFREIARNTGIAAGTVRHHLNVLGRSDIVVEHQHGSTVRLFENQAKFNDNWADLVLLREPPLGQLHAWLKGHPASPQKAVLEGMDAVGWSRSTTQHRLARLVDGGLATIRLQGRLKIYSIVDRARPPAEKSSSALPSPTQVPSRADANTA